MANVIVPSEQTTFSMLKPDGQWLKTEHKEPISSKFIDILYENGLVVDFAGMFYSSDSKETENFYKQLYQEHAGKPFFQELLDYTLLNDANLRVMVSEQGHVRLTNFMPGNMAMAVRGNNAVGLVREILGSTNPSEAHPESLRGRYGNPDLFWNIAHGSENENVARREIDLFFGDLICAGNNDYDCQYEKDRMIRKVSTTRDVKKLPRQIYCAINQVKPETLYEHCLL